MRKRFFFLLFSCLVTYTILAFPVKSLARMLIIFKGINIDKMDNLITLPNKRIVTLMEIQVAAWGTGYTAEDYLIYDPITRRCSLYDYYDYSITLNLPELTSIDEVLEEAPFFIFEVSEGKYTVYQNNFNNYQTYCKDLDRDSYGDPEICIQALRAPDGYVSDNTDCDDNDPAKFPGNPEICDGKDNNCDRQVDEEDSKGCTIYYKDEDTDGYGADGDCRCLCSPDEIEKYTAVYSGDLNDQDPNIQGTILTRNMSLPAGWSMISIPLISENASVLSLFPEAVVVYGYEKGSGYVRVKENEGLEVGDGYWILLDQNQNFTITGYSFQSYNKKVYDDGWEMIGGCTFNAQPKADNCNIGVVYRYVQGIGYQPVLDVMNLEPGKGYWILFNEVLEQSKLTVMDYSFIVKK